MYRLKVSLEEDLYPYLRQQVQPHQASLNPNPLQAGPVLTLSYQPGCASYFSSSFFMPVPQILLTPIFFSSL